TAAGSGFEVEDDHTYADPGHYTVSVVIWDEGGASLVLVGDATIEATVGTAAAGVRRNDPDRAELTPDGDATVAVNTGGLAVAQPLDFDLSPGTAAGGSPALVY